MFTDPQEQIGRFCLYFSKQICLINSIKSDKEDSTNSLKEALYCLLIDAISRSVYPRGKSRQRFTTFVKTFGEWKECELISAPHLWKLLNLDPDPVFSELRGKVFIKMKEWNLSWSEIKIDQDFKLSDIRELCPKNREMKIGNVLLEHINHLNLLYEYRSTLVHEFRTPGYGMEYDSKVYPFYHSLNSVEHEDGSGTDSIELVYPVGFLGQLSKNLLENLKRYLLDNKINPFDSYTFGSFWHESLNYTN